MKSPLFTTEHGEQYEVPVEGSLGLLAIGHKGLLAWRAKRKATQTEQHTTKVPVSCNK